MIADQLLRIGALGGSRALAALFGFAIVTLAANALGPEELGLWSMMLAVHGYALHTSEMGLRSVATAEAGYTGGCSFHLLSRYLTIRLLGCTAVTAVLLGATAMMAPQHLLPAALLASTLYAIALQLDWIALAGDRAVEAGALLLLRPSALLALLLLVSDVRGAEDMAALFAMAWWLAAAISWVTLRKKPARASSPIARGTLVRLGLPLMAVTLLSHAQASLDILVVGAVFGKSEAGLYYLAAAIVGAGLVIANAMGQLAMARMAHLRDRPGVFRTQLLRELRLIGLLALLGACALATASSVIIRPVFGESFAPAAGLVVWFLPWLILQSLSTVAQGALIAARMQTLLLRANLALVAALLLTLPLATLTESLIAFALARAVAETVRLSILLRPFLTDTRQSNQNRARYQHPA